MITMLIGTVFMILQDNREELWVGIAFGIAFSFAFMIYIKSLTTEKKRLQVIKDKKKAEKSKRGKHKKNDWDL